MAQKIQVRRGPSSSRTDIVLDQGEFAYDLDTKKTYVGDGVTPGGNLIGFITKSGKTAIPDTQNYLDVTFASPFGSANWHFLGKPIVRNTVDSNPDNILCGILTARTAEGFRVQLTAAVSGSNNVLEWEATLD